MNDITPWIESLTGQSPHTIRAYARAMRAFATWFEAEHRTALTPATITAIDLMAYRTLLQQQQRAASSINQQLAALRSFLAWSIECGYRTDNPTKRIRDVAIEAKRAPKALEAKEIHALLRAAQDHDSRDYAIVQCLVQTGMRLSECAALTLGDIVLSERMGHITIRAGKDNKQRRVPANASLRLALAEYLAPIWRVEPTVKSIAVAWSDRPAERPLWLGQKGPITVRTIARTIEALVAPLARSGLIPKETSAHTLRHTFATMYLADNPDDIVGLASLLGHSTIQTTRIYVQHTKDELHRRVERSRLSAYE